MFGDQRLQSRNILVVDLALAVLLGYWADQPFSGERGVGVSRVRAGRFFRHPLVRRIAPETVLGVVPPLAVVVVVTLGLTWGTGFLHWVGMGVSASASVTGRLKPWLLPYAVLGAVAAAFVIFGRRLGPRLRSRLLAGFVVVDLLVFTVLCVVEVGPGLFAAADASSASADGGGASTVVDQTTTATAPLRPVAALGYPGRFAIYDPDLLDPNELSGLDPPDVNAISGDAMPSVQGYSSTVDGLYASVTGSHQATGDGQDTLAPRAVEDGTLDQLDTSVLLTLSAVSHHPGRWGRTGRGAAGYRPARHRRGSECHLVPGHYE